MSNYLGLGPQRIGTITHAVSARGNWKGKIGPLRVHITASAQPDLEGRRLKYIARAGRVIKSRGVAGTVRDALEYIEQETRTV